MTTMTNKELNERINELAEKLVDTNKNSVFTQMIIKSQIILLHDERSKRVK